LIGAGSVYKAPECYLTPTMEGCWSWTGFAAPDPVIGVDKPLFQGVYANWKGDQYVGNIDIDGKLYGFGTVSMYLDARNVTKADWFHVDFPDAVEELSKSYSSYRVKIRSHGIQPICIDQIHLLTGEKEVTTKPQVCDEFNEITTNCCESFSHWSKDYSCANGFDTNHRSYCSSGTMTHLVYHFEETKPIDHYAFVKGDQPVYEGFDYCEAGRLVEFTDATVFKAWQGVDPNDYYMLEHVKPVLKVTEIKPEELPKGCFALTTGQNNRYMEDTKIHNTELLDVKVFTSEWSSITPETIVLDGEDGLYRFVTGRDPGEDEEVFRTQDPLLVVTGAESVRVAFITSVEQNGQPVPRVYISYDRGVEYKAGNWRTVPGILPEGEAAGAVMPSSRTLFLVTSHGNFYRCKIERLRFECELKMAGLSNPKGLALMHGAVYVAELGQGCVRQVYPRWGAEFGKCGKFDTEGLYMPWGIDFDHVGTLLITDAGHKKLLGYQFAGGTCPFKHPYPEKNKWECMDLSICNSQGCCSLGGGVRRCPKNYPRLCTDPICNGDSCCRMTCDFEGGDKVCPTDEAEPPYTFKMNGYQCDSTNISLGRASDLEACADMAIEYSKDHDYQALVFIYGVGPKEGECYLEDTKECDSHHRHQAANFDMYQINKYDNLAPAPNSTPVWRGKYVAEAFATDKDCPTISRVDYPAANTLEKCVELAAEDALSSYGRFITWNPSRTPKCRFQKTESCNLSQQEDSPGTSIYELTGELWGDDNTACPWTRGPHFEATEPNSYECSDLYVCQGEGCCIHHGIVEQPDLIGDNNMQLGFDIRRCPRQLPVLCKNKVKTCGALESEVVAGARTADGEIIEHRCCRATIADCADLGGALDCPLTIKPTQTTLMDCKEAGVPSCQLRGLSILENLKEGEEQCSVYIASEINPNRILVVDTTRANEASGALATFGYCEACALECLGYSGFQCTHVEYNYADPGLDRDSLIPDECSCVTKKPGKTWREIDEATPRIQRWDQHGILCKSFQMTAADREHAEAVAGASPTRRRFR